MGTEEKSTPETQDTSQEEQSDLFFGKYKTKDEAETAWKQMERERTEAKEALDREQRLNALLAAEDHTQPKPQQAEAAPQYTSLGSVFDDEQSQGLQQMLAQERKMILDQVRREGQQMLRSFKAQQDMERTFYEEHGDLLNFKDDVDAEAAKLAVALGEKASKVPRAELMKEVAKRTRERLAATKAKLTKSTLHVEGGEALEPQVQLKPKGPDTSSDVERTVKFFEEEVEEFNQKKFRPLRR